MSQQPVCRLPTDPIQPPVELPIHGRFSIGPPPPSPTPSQALYHPNRVSRRPPPPRIEASNTEPNGHHQSPSPLLSPNSTPGPVKAIRGVASGHEQNVRSTPRVQPVIDAVGGNPYILCARQSQPCCVSSRMCRTVRGTGWRIDALHTPSRRDCAVGLGVATGCWRGEEGAAPQLLTPSLAGPWTDRAGWCWVPPEERVLLGWMVWKGVDRFGCLFLVDNMFRRYDGWHADVKGCPVLSGPARRNTSPSDPRRN